MVSRDVSSEVRFRCPPGFRMAARCLFPEAESGRRVWSVELGRASTSVAGGLHDGSSVSRWATLRKASEVWSGIMFGRRLGLRMTLCRLPCGTEAGRKAGKSDRRESIRHQPCGPAVLRMSTRRSVWETERGWSVRSFRIGCASARDARRDSRR